MENFRNVTVFDHPLITHKLSILRDINTGSKQFRELVQEIGMLMGYEVMRDLPLKEVTIQTPIAEAKVQMIAGKKLALVPILRAGLGMRDGVLSLVPSAKIGHIGLYRDPETHEPKEYYCKLPEDIENSKVFVLDPMFATGGSASAAITFLKQRGCKDLCLVCLVAANPAIDRMAADHPDVPIYCAALDECLNENAYIVPGLGDAGDRIFGTK